MKFKIVPVTAYQQNCTVLWCEETNKAAVVDPGGDLNLIEAVIADEKLALEKILVTHAHLDHAGCVAEMARKYNAPIEGPHKEEQFWIDLLPQQGQMMGIAFKAETFKPNRWLDCGDKVTIGNQTLEVRFCPGHTPGHIIFYHPESKLAQVGDVLFKGSIGRTDFPRGDHATLISSIKTKLWPLGNDVRFIPGHGPMSTFGEERKTNPYVRDQ